MSARLLFLGTGTAFNSEARANQCLLFSGSSGRWYLDFGPTSLLQTQRFGIDPTRVEGVCLTHLHADHALGLPLLLLHYQFAAPRERPFVVVGPPGTESYVRQSFELSYPDVARHPRSFGLEIVELDGARRERTEIRGLAIEAFAMRHSVPVNGYRLCEGGRTLALSGDTGPTQTLFELARDADFLVLECSFLRPFDPPIHLSADDIERARGYGAKRLALIHMGSEALAARDELSRRLGALVPDDGEEVDF